MCVKNRLRHLGCHKKLDALLWGTLARKQAPTTSKTDIHQKKVLLSFWWDYKGIVNFELLPRCQTINSEVYIRQLTNLNDTIQEKRPELANSKGIVFHHHNARPSPSLATGQKLLELGWNVLLHPPYSPKLAPNNYHFFRFLKNFLNGQKFQNDNEVKTALEQFFAPKTKELYKKRKMIPPEKCQKVTNNNKHNIIDKNNLT
ncbi:mariner transposase, putative [Pediculus humanus corporis]|uniref:Mariner transposase, putative n=1 Tax=Pediculus humanus subsp. corporis TaxID=121224 RepID=E0VWJ1_PEDHC|nr:mariner transposase, putative [Pediculus humanus corporis]XP_002431906.1 mariner transposase, putative [Pediculus humanus corporis]XP_002433181.1 mariner transposase, putative [Pediculus humanus corporis]EEB17747.1 mariner transposase, putative [Pediculus humanus corporis]EEB19168.1 mariner transposase, putative [Pediculus humanus corporis]EEB20443.1 mariner transposase, putative [Pediculus humanus corporis]